MSGPSLKQLHAHHAIHEGGRAGAVQKIEYLKEVSKTGDLEKINQSVEDLIYYWENRILTHADSEEEENGFYQEVLQQKPELKEEVIALTRDHDILRIIIKKIKDKMKEEGFSDDIIFHFESLIIVNEIHSRDEEKLLLQDD
ncbi:hypothetical protein [Alkalibacillus aidingensis]|uniref:hypothetical protein n=1 Tax=Alkalibacillus aidingensis TaxID=2747607 RepID=UPI0016600B20|nr:hypothetical protein [Alkalibacillus aidingensis]